MATKVLMKKKLLLGSGGIRTPERELSWKRELRDFLGDVQQVLFVPYALADHDGYLEQVIGRHFLENKDLIGIHRNADPQKAIQEAKAIYVGGGNTFRLLNELYRKDLLAVIRERVNAGELQYIGVSAGTNVTCPTVRTTNDMPICEPKALTALGLIKFQINPHYFAGAIHYPTPSGFQPYAGETRDDRIAEFLEMNEGPVLGLWEGAILKVEGERLTLKGAAGARLFQRGKAAKDFDVGADLSFLLS